MSSSPSNAKGVAPIPPAKAIDVLQNQYALLYANLHPVLLLSILFFSFRTLVEDPVNTLLGLAPTIAIIQAVYCVLSLPPKGQTPTSTPKPGQKKKSQRAAQDIWAKIVVCKEGVTSMDFELMLFPAGVLVAPFDALPLSAVIIHHPHPLRRATHHTPSSHGPTCPPSRTVDDATTFLRAWARDTNMVKNCQPPTPCGRVIWAELGRLCWLVDRRDSDTIGLG